ncbi:hypothetical protein KR767_20935 [Luteibacter anthropi]|uniref:hypothetical protein n=1 Tax=Luteibacter anthropi TaxID=564369 RepID=UPI002032F57B|nr:hypothetical protein [Luteibacter anthropi]URX62466.1 hypothetical protein KR767_20935 [Luteibacter anthropi]
MKFAVMIASAISFVMAILYLSSMARLASLLQRESGIHTVGIDGPNAQLKLFRVVFFGKDLDRTFSDRHAGLLASARWSGGIGLGLFIAVFVGALLGFAG